MNGKGELNAENLENKFCDVLVGGTGVCSTYAKIGLNVVISGGGTVKYKGTPDKLNQNLSKNATLERI